MIIDAAKRPTAAGALEHPLFRHKEFNFVSAQARADEFTYLQQLTKPLVPLLPEQAPVSRPLEDKKRSGYVNALDSQLSQLSETQLAIEQGMFAVSRPRSNVADNNVRPGNTGANPLSQGRKSPTPS